jgi:hypothetical protein
MHGGMRGLSTALWMVRLFMALVEMTILLGMVILVEASNKSEDFGELR